MSKNRRKPVRRKGQMRRHSLAKVNTGPTSSSVNSTLMAEYTARARTLGRDTAFLDAMYPGAGKEGKNVPRLAAMRRRMEYQLNEAGVTPDRRLVVYQDTRKRVMLFFNEDHTRYFFIREEFDLGSQQKSISYGTLSVARQKFETGGILWFDPELIP